MNHEELPLKGVTRIDTNETKTISIDSILIGHEKLARQLGCYIHEEELFCTDGIFWAAFEDGQVLESTTRFESLEDIDGLRPKAIQLVLDYLKGRFSDVDFRWVETNQKYKG